ncbi:MAG TPA: class I SAM-dependent methyltransferase [Ktedonobacterales bacterium]|jgi:ubiquinone/menaquinone biosynthesis C-methylase UbiE
MIDIAALRSMPERQGRPPRVLDVACGTGIFLKQLLEQVPNLEAYGIDASADMLAQAQALLAELAQVHLEQVEVGTGETELLPYAPETFDLITCTNALHDLPDPVGMLVRLRRLLASGGQLVLEDFARRAPPFPWKVFEWLVRRVVGRQVHVYTLKEAESLCREADLHIVCEKTFSIDWLLHGWGLRASRPHFDKMKS